MAKASSLTSALAAIDDLDSLDNGQAVLEATQRIVSGFGVSGLVFFRLPAARGTRFQIVLNGWPSGWALRYDQAGHQRHDPVLRYCADCPRPFAWGDIPAQYYGDPEAAEVQREAAAFGLGEGLCIPVRTPLGVGGLSLAGERIDMDAAFRLVASSLAHRLEAITSSLAIGKAGKRALTVRERDVLGWIANGKTVQDIATILGISDHTVGEHLKHIRHKLHTSNNVHSVVTAMQLGQLRL